MGYTCIFQILNKMQGFHRHKNKGKHFTVLENKHQHELNAISLSASKWQK